MKENEAVRYHLLTKFDGTFWVRKQSRGMNGIPYDHFKVTWYDRKNDAGLRIIEIRKRAGAAVEAVIRRIKELRTQEVTDDKR